MSFVFLPLFPGALPFYPIWAANMGDIYLILPQDCKSGEGNSTDIDRSILDLLYKERFNVSCDQAVIVT